ncbi:MAG: oligosaccharide flippase family protein [Paludibacteraceae bacterium]|nr:oligosaccharide flippase family protein [Paludibacteraceae bacterium]
MNSKIANFSKLLSANVLAQAVGILIYPILTRLYQPADFTLLNLFLTIANALLIISTLDLQYAIPLPNKDEGAYALCGTTVVTISATMGIILIICLFYDNIALFFGIETLGWAIWFLPLYVTIMSISQVVLYIYNREKEFGKIARFQMVQSLSNSALKLIFGLFSFGGLALVDASVIGPIIASSLMIKKIISIVDGFRTIPIPDAIAYLKKYRDFPLFSMPKNLVCHLSNGLPVLILTPAFGATEVGYFALAITIGYLPLSMIASSIYQVMLRDVSERLNQGQPIFPLVHKFCIFSSVILLFGCWCLNYILPSLTEFLFGDGWRTTGEILRILLPWFATNFMAASLVFVPETLLKLKGNLIIELTFIVLRVLILLLGVSKYDLITTIYLFSAVSFVVKLCQVGWYCIISKRNDDKQLKFENS